MGINDIIRLHRMELKLSQEELGTKIYKGQQYVSDIERGRIEPDIDELIEINKLFQCELIEGYLVLKQMKPYLMKVRIA